METIGIVASETCKENGKGKRWFHLRKFIKAYCEVLPHFRVVTTDSTAKIIEEVISQISNPANKRLNIEPLGNPFRGVVRLAAMVARGDVRRVLMFQDPKDLDIERPERYALLRNCNLSGSKLHINASVHLWALYECKRLNILQNHPYHTVPVNAGDLKETIAFIAHDSEKSRMARFALHYRDVIRRFPRLIATSGTKK
jgi:methylglyoxal synthase